jgi:hypothetical protein
MGRYIAIYYGSYAGVFGDLEGEELLEELREDLMATIKHEFRHHLESLGGSDDLERDDDDRLENYLSRTDSDE